MLGDMVLVHFYFETEEHTSAIIFFRCTMQPLDGPVDMLRFSPGSLFQNLTT